MEAAKPQFVLAGKAPTEVAIQEEVQAAVQRALTPALLWRQEAEARLDRLESEIAELRKKG
jgi:hypothetical protein